MSSSSAASFPNSQLYGAVGATLAAQLGHGQLPVLVHARDLGLRKGPCLTTPSDWSGFTDWCYQMIEASGLKTASKTMKGFTDLLRWQKKLSSCLLGQKSRSFMAVLNSTEPTRASLAERACPKVS